MTTINADLDWVQDSTHRSPLSPGNSNMSMSPTPRSPRKISDDEADAQAHLSPRSRLPRTMNRTVSTSKLKRKSSRSRDNSSRPELYEVSSPSKSPVKKKLYQPTPKDDPDGDDITLQNLAAFEMMNGSDHYSEPTYSSPAGKRGKMKRMNSERQSRKQGSKPSSKSSSPPTKPKRTSSVERKTLTPPSFERQPPRASNSQRSLMSTASRSSKAMSLHDSSHPMTLVALLKRFASAKSQQEARSCLKQSLKRRKSSSNMMSKRKSVTFATNSYNDRVWGLVKSVDHHNDIELDEYWWSDDEMDDIRDTILDQAAIVEEDYGETLHRAYQSTMELPPESKNDPYSAVSSSNPSNSITELMNSVDLCFDSVAQVADAARGLEAAVARSIIIDVKARHREAILGTQDRLREEKGNGLGSKYAFDDSDLRLLRKHSVESSRSSRLVAAKMARFDQSQANMGGSDSSVQYSVQTV